MTEASHIIAKAQGSRRAQFIASVRKAVKSVGQGRSPLSAIGDIEKALDVLDKKDKA